MAEFQRQPTRKDVAMPSRPQDQTLETVSVGTEAISTPQNTNVIWSEVTETPTPMQTQTVVDNSEVLGTAWSTQRASKKSRSPRRVTSISPRSNRTVNYDAATRFNETQNKTQDNFVDDAFRQQMIWKSQSQSIWQPESQMIGTAQSQWIWESQSQMLWQPQSQMIWEAQSFNIDDARSVANKAFNLINKAVESWRSVSEDQKAALVKRLAEDAGIWEFSSAVAQQLDWRFRENNFQTVEDLSDNVEIEQAKLDQYASMPTTELSALIESNSVPNDILQKMRGTPEYDAAMQKIQEKKNSKISNDMINGSVTTSDVPTTNKKDIVSDLWLDWQDISADIKRDIDSISSDSDLSTLSSDIGNIDSDIASTQAELSRIKQTVEEEFPTSLSKSALNSIVYDRQLALNQKLQTQLALRDAKVWDYQRQKQEKELEVQRKIDQQRFNMDFLSSNGGAALFWSTVNELRAMEQSGWLPEWFWDIYSNYQEGMVFNALSQFGVPNNQDITSISAMLQQWATPNEVLSKMLENPKFQPVKDNTDLMTKTVKSWDYAYQFNPKTWRFDLRVWWTDWWAIWLPAWSSDFSLFEGRAWTYPNNHWADYAAPKWTPIPMPFDWVVEEIKTWPDAGIRAVIKLSDWRKMTVDHLDESTLSAYWLPSDFQWSKKIWAEFRAWDTLWFVGNTWTVATTQRNPETGKDEMVYIRKWWETLRPDLLHRWNHASVAFYDEEWNLLDQYENDRILKDYAKQSQQADLSWLWSIVRNYVEDGKVPKDDVLESLWLTKSQFLRWANDQYLKDKNVEYNLKWFKLEDPTALSAIDSSTRRQLDNDINAMQALDDSMATLISMVEKHWPQLTRLPKEAAEFESTYLNALLQAKEVYNLWVLNWPDLDIMKWLIKNPIWPEAEFRGKEDMIDILEQWRMLMRNRVTSQAANFWLQYDESLKPGWSQQSNQVDPFVMQQQFSEFMDNFY